MKLLDLFSGIGGFSLAASWTGIETVAFCEIDDYCRRVLAKNFPGVPIHEDIRKLKRESISGTVDIISGGFPCQPFSTAGKRRGKEDDRYLWPEMLRVISEVRPAWVLGENVAGIINMELDKVFSDLEAAGYTCEAVVIPAVAVDAQHRRDRVWVVANSEGARDKELGQPHRRKNSIAQKRAGWVNFLHGVDLQKGTVGSNLESIVCRKNDGVSNWVDRLRGLGNAIVPQVAYWIFRAIVAVEEQIKEQSA